MNPSTSRGIEHRLRVIPVSSVIPISGHGVVPGDGRRRDGRDPGELGGSEPSPSRLHAVQRGECSAGREGSDSCSSNMFAVQLEYGEYRFQSSILNTIKVSTANATSSIVNT